MQELEVARRAAQIGGEVVSRYFRDGVTMRSKSTSNLVSDADLESERVIAACITESFPNHVILGEELHTGEVTAEDLWIIDPIDGTNNFAHGIPHFAISIAYYRSGQAVCGVVFNPARDDWFVAVRGEGATYNGKPAAVAQADSLSEVLVGLGFYYDRGAMMEATLAAARDLFGQEIHGIRRFGTASLDLCQVGTGMFGGFFEYQLSPWDFAAGRLFVEEAGGRVTTARGDALPLETTSVLASNGTLHESLLSIVAAHHP
ncbi:Inositol-1-monophosphatase [Maioricimonas rarisocia]|uniref:Inositol-1-monophosphatase n=1 Tax=Maioricimonas rarisocia TaxID=2528026 RepID=A0A517ZD11_9PLAN|nr:inositol monophosphatase family protein [Maioricimonas rarisocia]QDU40368.1 Inositol-1-monophosphatase [Maioricimonas rarisocia]